MMRQREGLTLLELIVAAAIGGILVGAAVSVLRQTGASLGRGGRRDRANAVAEEALAVALSLAQAAVAVTVVGDTTLAYDARVLDAMPCADGSVVPLAAADATVPAAGDRWLTLTAVPSATSPDSLAWLPSAPHPVRHGTMGCIPSDSTGVLVRAVRSGRLVPYRTVEGTWMLGIRACEGVCTPAQPVAGPIRAPAAGGWRVRAVPCGIDVAVWAEGAASARWATARRC